MQLPDHLLRTYRRYKESEQYLLSWVCATAPIAFSTSASDRKDGNPVKLKGRARTQARREAQATSKAAAGNPSSASSTFAQISLFDILPRVKAIAENPTIKIPTEIIVTFKTVLQLRQRCVAWFKSNTSQYDSKTIEANKKHLYPVWVLQRAVRLLVGKISSKREVHGQPSTEENIGSENPSNNIFDLLDLEDTIDDPDEAPSIPPNAKSSFELPPKTSKEDRMQDEFNLAMYCLHSDLEELEDYLVLEIARYATDQKNADTLPFLINTAIDQALYMSNDICKLVDDPGTAREKFEEFDHKNNKQARATSPLKRMQGLVGMEMTLRKAEERVFSRITRDNSVRGIHHGRLPFPSREEDMDYLTASDNEKWWIESRFLHTCWSEDSPKSPADFRPFWLDSLLKCIRELKYYSANWHDGRRPGQIPIGAVFGIRILLLATIVIGERKLPTYNNLLETATRSSLDMQQWKDMETTLQNKVSHAEHVSSLKMLSHDMPTHKQVRKSLRPSFEFNPMLCCLNDVIIRSSTSVLSIQVLDRSFIFRVLSHLWNLLRELGHLERAWPDLDAIVEQFGEGFAYQGGRPTLASGKKVLWSRYWYAFGIKYRDVPKILKRLSLQNPGTSYDQIRSTSYFTTRNWPLLHILIDRGARGLYGNPDGAVDAGLIAHATVVAPLSGQEKLYPQFGDNGGGTFLENKADLWKLYDRGPGLAGVDRLHAIKRGLRDELTMNDFAYLKLVQACVELVDTLLVALDNLEGGPVSPFLRENTACKIKHISFDLLVSDNTNKWKKVAKVFEKWLEKYGSVCQPTKVQAAAVVYPLPLRPDVVQLVRDIVARRGLVEGVFTKEQEYGLGVSATYSWEEKIRERAGRRS